MSGPNQSVDEGTDVTLDGSGSDDTDGSIVSYVWTINGVEVGTGLSPVLSDLESGVHTITLSVTDNTGAIATDSVEVEVTDPVLLANDDTGMVLAGGSVAIDVT